MMVIYLFRLFFFVFFSNVIFSEVDDNDDDDNSVDLECFDDSDGQCLKTYGSGKRF